MIMPHVLQSEHSRKNIPITLNICNSNVDYNVFKYVPWKLVYWNISESDEYENISLWSAYTYSEKICQVGYSIIEIRAYTDLILPLRKHGIYISLICGSRKKSDIDYEHMDTSLTLLDVLM
jgi:hypothetical protein